MKLIEQILAKNNVREALHRVVSNKGASGIDGMKVEELRDYMNANWTSIKQSILERRYKPAPYGGLRYLSPTEAYASSVSRQLSTEPFNNRLSKSSLPSLRQSFKRTATASALAGTVSKPFRSYWNTSTRERSG